jgi:hypothetical protein
LAHHSTTTRWWPDFQPVLAEKYFQNMHNLLANSRNLLSITYFVSWIEWAIASLRFDLLFTSYVFKAPLSATQASVNRNRKS